MDSRETFLDFEAERKGCRRLRVGKASTGPEIEMNDIYIAEAAKEPPKTKFVPPPPRGGSRLKTNGCRAAYWRRRAICIAKKLAIANREARRW